MVFNFQVLPEELLVEVLSFLPKPDLKSARLTCVQWGRLGAQWLFERVYFAPRQAAINDFLSIAANREFSRKVEALVYDGRLFMPAFDSFPAYQHPYSTVICKRQRLGFHIGVDDWYPLDDGTSADPYRPAENNPANSLVQYVRLLDKQQEILQEDKDIGALSTGLRAFQNITQINICDDFSQFPDHELLSSGDYQWYDRRSAEDFGRAIAPFGWEQNRRHTTDESEFDWDTRGIRHFFHVLAMHCPNIKDLCMGSWRSSVPMSIFDQIGKNRANLCAIAKRLQKLRIYCRIPTDTSAELFEDRRACMADVLSDATQLRSLSCDGMLDFSIFLENEWPHLRKFALGDVNVHEEDLLSFTQEHKHTLRQLGLRNVLLQGDQSWAEIGKVISKYLRLNILYVASLADDVTTVITGNPYIEPNFHMVVARNFMQWVPHGRLLLEEEANSATATVLPEVDGHSGSEHDDQGDDS